MAYIGPGAGFAFLGSFLVLLTAIVLVIVAVLSWPFRVALALLFRRGRKRARTDVRRVVIVGLDGFDAGRCERLLAAGRLPHLDQLRREGCFRPLLSTCPPISPVAWSTFMTGANPGKHNIFDFLNRDLRTYLPVLAIARVTPARGRRPAGVKLLRKSRTFWSILGEYGVFSSILRVPVTFPPEKFRGLCLSGLGVPDLLGTQGTFTAFSDAKADGAEAKPEGGRRVHVSFQGDRAKTWLGGPSVNRGGKQVELRLPLEIRLAQDRRAAFLHIAGQRIRLETGTYSDWVRLKFRRRFARPVSGLCRFYLASVKPGFLLYATPLNIDPERPALPVSHPPYYSIYLAKLLGSFATLGMAEDTWARNEGVLDDKAFLDQVYRIHEERERMFFAALDRLRRGLLVYVFEASDRIQHMFTRPAEKDAAARARCEQAVEDMYVRMDDLVGRVAKRMRKQDVLMVVSDHGFTEFSRGVNLNVWLKQEGYLAVGGAPDKEYLQSVDWSKTRAYTFGLSGIYLNRKGRESGGIVADSEVVALKREIEAGLMKLADPQTGRQAVRKVYDAAEMYSGPYAGNGPDLVIGYDKGYRASWEAAVGRTDGEIFSDNTKPWGGDHCVDREVVPGVFFCSRPLEGRERPELADVGPTVLSLFGVPPPDYMDGEPLPLRG
ncbi:MAG: alkaline phosphatase family protein, partial [Kiritimatiellae bacterium]|nr:alkaline phosphatase family protein [Kiritimatiellia bacterium]